jgi:hypothetical protein
MTILDALADRNLLGALPAFHDLATWHTWLVFLRAIYGLPMTAAQRAIFTRKTEARRSAAATARRRALLVARAESRRWPHCWPCTRP